MGPALGAPKVGKCNFLNSKMADCNHIVHWRKNFRKQKSSVSLSFSWSVPKFLVSDQTLVSYRQSTIFQEFGPLKQTLGKDDLSMSIFWPSGVFLAKFGFQPLQYAKERICTNFHLDWLFWRMSRKGGGQSLPPPLLRYATTCCSQ